MTDDYNNLKKELHHELQQILGYWSKYTIDEEYGGFVGKIDHENNVIPYASKGIILNSRILWAFAAASNYLQTDIYKVLCRRSYNYLITFFQDMVYGGVFWELNCEGKPINKRKQIYAQAFMIYALCEYYTNTKIEKIKSGAIRLFDLVEKYAKDEDGLGYIEAFQEDWTSITDMRLSSKDMNASKTMNTHLHILESYTALLKIYDSEKLRNSLTELVELFLNTFLNQKNHFDLFFDDEWNLMSNVVSYGHDIETAWLVTEAATTLGDKDLIKKSKAVAIRVADTFLTEGIDNDGGVWNESNYITKDKDMDKHWWPQVEALIGLKYAYDLTKDDKYLENAIRIWNFTKKYLIDRTNGEWYFRVTREGTPYPEDKVSMWKAPYHTVRACILMNR